MSRTSVGIAFALLAAPVLATTTIDFAAGGAVTIRAEDTRLEDLKQRLEQSPLNVELRIAVPELADHRVTAFATHLPPDSAVQRILAAFNYTAYRDQASGRQVYLLTSLADPHAPAPARKLDSAAGKTAEGPRAPARAAPGTASATRDAHEFPPGKGPTRTPPPRMAARAVEQPDEVRSLDDVRTVDPVSIPEPYGPQDAVDAEVARVNRELAARARDVLASGNYSPAVQQQALNELIRLGDGAALSQLQRSISDPRVVENPATAEAIAQAAWRLAAQQQFANAEANRLLQSLANSTHPQFQSVGQAALRDQRSYTARNPKN